MKTTTTFAKLIVLGLIISASLVYAASHSRASGIAYSPGPPPSPSVPKKGLPIHGPFDVSSANLGASGGGSGSAEDGSPASVPVISGKAGGAGESSGPQTPKPMVSFLDTAGLAGGDPGVAVSNGFVLVSDERNGIALYDKAGSPLGPKPGTNFPNPFAISSLFAQVQTDVNSGLIAPSGLPPGFSMKLKTYGDVRIMFDSYRKRFWIYAMLKSDGYPDAAQFVKYPALKLTRRDKAAVAVSKTEDPRDGFYTYWWNETIHNGECNVPAGCSDPVFKSSGEGADYPSIGMSPKYFLASIGVNRRDPTFKTDSVQSAQDWIDCKSPFTENGQTFKHCGPFYVNLMVADADALASGCSVRKNGPPQCAAGRAFPLFVDANNYITDRTEDGSDFTTNMARGVKPVVMHGPQTADGYFVNNFIDRPDNQATKSKIAGLETEIKDLSKALNGASLAQMPALAQQITKKQAEIAALKKTRYDLVVWSLVGDTLVPTLYPITSFTFDHFYDWRIVLNASARDGKLYSTFNQCWPGVTDKCYLSIRVLRVNTLTGKTEIDRIFGLNSTVDDKPSDRFHYSFPGIEVNKHGDMVIVYTRYSADKAQHLEVRYSVWYHDEADIRPSRLLKGGESDYATGTNLGTDTAGVAVDPSDDEAIWVAQSFAAKDDYGNGYRRIAVGRVFGPSPPRRTQAGN